MAVKISAIHSTAKSCTKKTQKELPLFESMISFLFLHFFYSKMKPDHLDASADIKGGDDEEQVSEKSPFAVDLQVQDGEVDKDDAKQQIKDAAKQRYSSHSSPLTIICTVSISLSHFSKFSIFNWIMTTVVFMTT